MTSTEFWKTIQKIISEGFLTEGLKILDRYAEQFINGEIIFHRFSSSEQHGCAAGGATNVIATLLAATEIASDRVFEAKRSFILEQKIAKQQIHRIYTILKG